MKKCPECQHEMTEKYWGGGDIRVSCYNCGYVEIGKKHENKLEEFF